MNKISWLFLFFVIGFVLIIFNLNQQDNKLRVYFFDVGQGDAILLRTPDGQNILIDGGPDNLLLYHLGQALPWWDRTIDYLVISHYHADHYMSFPELVKKYKIKNILTTAHQPDDFLYKIWLDSLSERGINQRVVEAGQIFKINDDLFWQVLSADSEHEDFNDNSLVIRFVYREISFVFMGDLPIEGEDKILSSGLDIKSNVLKVGHHGSKYSSGDYFLLAIDPDICIIQSGQDNKFGHPHQEALLRLNQVDCTVLDTQNRGNIVLISDGYKWDFVDY